MFKWLFPEGFFPKKEDSKEYKQLFWMFLIGFFVLGVSRYALLGWFAITEFIKQH